MSSKVTCEDTLICGNVINPLICFLPLFSPYLSMLAFSFLLSSFFPTLLFLVCFPTLFVCFSVPHSTSPSAMAPFSSLAWAPPLLSFLLPLSQVLESTKYLFHLKTVPYTVLSILWNKQKNKLAPVLESSLSF